MQISKTDLEKLYKENKNTIVCEKLGISQPTLIKLLKENGIAIKGKGKRVHLGGVVVTE